MLNLGNTSEERRSMSMKRHLGPAALAVVLSLGLAACTQTASTPSAPSPLAAAGATSGCAGEIAQFRAVLKSDVDTGNVGQSVYNRANADLAQAESACAAGREGEARSRVASTKSRFGYRS
jgi:hypothetical protein